MTMNPNRPFYKIGPVMYLDKIPEEHMFKFIIKRFNKFKIKIPDTSIKKILTLSENIPYYIQLLSHETWDYAVLSKKKEINNNDIDIIFDQIIKQYEQNYKMFWERLTTRKKQVIRTISIQNGKKLLSKKTLDTNELGLPSSTQRTLESLMAENYIDKIDSKYFIVDILFKEWIKRYTI